jgi:membrane protease YdiL (CAAX protease family)
VVVFLAGFISANFIGAIPLLVVIVYKIIESGGAISPNPENIMDLSVYGINSNIGLILMIIPFAVGLITVVLLFKPLHKRTLVEVINGTKKVRWDKLFFATAIWGILMLVYLVIDYYSNSENFVVNYNVSSLLPLIIISVFLLPFQVAYEEVLFRGYFAQGVAAWTKSRWWAIIIPGIIFGLMHAINPEVKAFGFWFVMPQYMIFGLLFGLVTILDDGIESALGAHIANNVFASIFVTHKASALQTPALLEQLQVNPVKETVILLMMSIFFIIILSKKYKWKFSILNEKIEPLILTDNNDNNEG